MASNAYVTGIGMHKFGRWTEKSTIDLAATAIAMALDDAAIAFTDVQAAYLGAEYSSFVDGRMIVQHFGWTGITINHYQQACASGSAAFREACHAIDAGRIDIALVAGYEKMGGGLLKGGDVDRDREFHLHRMGLDVTPARIAMAIQRRMHDYGETPGMLAAEAAQCFGYGSQNPWGPQRPAVTVDEVLDSGVICSPLTRKMCCNSSDGAAAVIVMSKRKAAELGCLDRAVEVAGIASGSPDADDLVGGPGAHIGGDFRAGSHTRKVSAKAYEMAGVGPDDIDIVQCHAPFAGGGIICAEALGFCAEGEGGRFFMEGHARIDGRTPINTDGGLLARGHPLGATGVAEVFELTRQLRGDGGALQVPGNPKVALAHNTGLGCLNAHIFIKH